MLDTFKKEVWARFIFAFFVFFTLWWLYLRFVDPLHIQNQIFSALYGTVALVGAIFGIHTSNKWGGYKSLVGRSILMFSLGLLLQEFGQIVYSFYVFFLNVDIPYPSIGDLGYFGSIPCYIYGIWLLGSASGVKITSKQLSSLFLAILIPIALLTGAYILFLQGYEFDWSSPLTVLLDFGYPFGEAIYISVAILTYLLSRKVLGGVMKEKVLFILFALLIQFFADYTFLYLARYDTVLPGGINDFLYLIAYFTMSLGLVRLKTVFDSLKGGR